MKSIMRECVQPSGKDSTRLLPGFNACWGESKIPQATVRPTRKIHKTDQRKGLVAPSCPTLCDPVDCSPARLPCPSASPRVLGPGVRTSTHGKGHEEGGSTYSKAGSSLRSPPGNSRASTPKTRVCLLYYFVLSPTPLTLRGAVPHHLFQRRS